MRDECAATEKSATIEPKRRLGSDDSESVEHLVELLQLIDDLVEV